jgi:two-component system, OmpR family, copper resistance phosphate regulon response regulator CusR
MRLLIVEDEPKTARFLRQGLVDAGFEVDVARNGVAGLEQTKRGGYGAIVLDWMLPGRDGGEILAELRRAGDETPVLVLTARDAVEDRVRGLDLGADDYLVKPFAVAELLARLRALLRRTPSRSPDTLRIADLELDLLMHRATRGGERLDLTPTEFRLLTLLAQRTGEVLSRGLIAERIWEMDAVPSTNLVDVHVRRLRSKVDDRFRRKLVHTVRGVGYVVEDRG